MNKYLVVLLLLMSAGFVKGQNQNMQLISSLSYNQDLNDIWGYVDSLGNEYALVGARNGVSIVDVTNPNMARQVKFFPGPSSTWRDLKTWKGFAYVSNETSGGIFIMDLRSLPDTSKITATWFTGDQGNLSSIHNLYIDENGICYVFGSNLGRGGCIMYDVDSNRLSPIEVGRFDQWYIHDGMARGDTLYSAHINDGFFTVTDISNKNNPTVLGQANTPNNFTHNIWVSDDGDNVFTTDERSAAFIGSYDISDLQNITEVDREQSNPGSGVIPHNVHVLGDFLVTSYYNDGVTVHDISRPHNVVQVGNYDTDPTRSGNGFTGSWGAYPYFASGKVVASDIRRGLYVLEPNYIKASYLEGKVTETGSGNDIDNASIQVLGKNLSDRSDVIGDYAIGTLDTGTFSVRFSKAGFTSDTAHNVVLRNGVLTVVNMQLTAVAPISINITVSDERTMLPLPAASLKISDGTLNYQAKTNSQGNASFSAFIPGTYNLTVGKWGHETKCLGSLLINSSQSIELDTAWFDDFTFDYGWLQTSSATTGLWVRDIPFGTLDGNTYYNPPGDDSLDCGEHAFVTGNNGSTAGDDDIDNGETILTSPSFSVNNYTRPYLSYKKWFALGGGTTNPDDTLRIFILQGANKILLESLDLNSISSLSAWTSSEFDLTQIVSGATPVRLMVEVGDLGNQNWVEAGFDVFQVIDSARNNTSIEPFNSADLELKVSPNPGRQSSFLQYNLNMLPVAGESAIEIFDLGGRLIKSYDLSSVSGSFMMPNDLNQGLYIVSLSHAGLSKRIKFIQL